ncbi:transposase, partial [Colletotrichum incanum]
TTSLLLPPTSNYHNISIPYANNLIFSPDLPSCLMAQYPEDDVNQAIQAVCDGKSLRRLSPDQEAKLAEWVRIQHALGLAPTHQQVKVFAERILHTMGDTDPLGKAWI